MIYLPILRTLEQVYLMMIEWGDTGCDYKYESMLVFVVVAQMRALCKVNLLQLRMAELTLGIIIS